MTPASASVLAVASRLLVPTPTEYSYWYDRPQQGRLILWKSSSPGRILPRKNVGLSPTHFLKRFRIELHPAARSSGLAVLRPRFSRTYGRNRLRNITRDDPACARDEADGPVPRGAESPTLVHQPRINLKQLTRVADVDRKPQLRSACSRAERSVQSFRLTQTRRAAISEAQHVSIRVFCSSSQVEFSVSRRTYRVLASAFLKDPRRKRAQNAQWFYADFWVLVFRGSPRGDDSAEVLSKGLSHKTGFVDRSCEGTRFKRS
jgi:hypothetical protein